MAFGFELLNEYTPFFDISEAKIQTGLGYSGFC